MSSERDRNRKHYLCLSPGVQDNEGTIEFLSYYPEAGVIIDGATVKVKLEYDRATQRATLYVYAHDAHDATILFDDVKEVHVTHLEEEEEEEEEAD